MVIAKLCNGPCIEKPSGFDHVSAGKVSDGIAHGPQEPGAQRHAEAGFRPVNDLPWQMRFHRLAQDPLGRVPPDLEGGGYGSGEVHEFPVQERDPDFDRSAFLRLLDRYFVAEELKTDWGTLTEAEDEMLINALSMLCPFDAEDKQALLEAPTLQTRRETLVTLIEFALAGGNGEIPQ